MLGSTSLLVRVLAVLVAIAVVLSLWMHDSLSTFKFKSWQAGSPPSSNMSLSDVFFPVSDAPEVNLLARENSKMLHALVTCMEHRNCHQNQTKGSSIVYLNFCSLMSHILRIVVILASPNFRDYLQGSRGGESIWYEFLFLVSSLQPSYSPRQGILRSTWLLELDCPQVEKKFHRV